MPITSLILTNQLPIDTYTSLVVTSASIVAGMAGNLLADGLGNQITLLAVTVSYAHTSSIQTSWEESSSYASSSMWSTTASWSSHSFSATTASWASESFSAFSATTASWASHSFSATTASWASSSFSSTTASWASHSFSATTASWASASLTSSYISPAVGAVSDMQNATGSAGGTPGSFSSAAELEAFILAVSQSFITLNTLIADLRSLGLIT